MATEKFLNESLLIIFYRNPELGKVKTRLAKSIGDGRAFSIYLLLCEHTRSAIETLPVHKAVYYSDHIDPNDIWSASMYQKFLQSKGDLGQKMESAFIAGFAAGYKSICIIGTDCLELRGRIITEAFEKLLSHDLTVGPAADGGYYLLGMNRLYGDLFKNKQWGNGTVLTDTLDDVKSLGLSCWQLEVLNDIDRVADLPPNFGLDQ